MSSQGPSPIATTLAEKMAVDGDWSQATLDRSTTVDLQIHAEPKEADTARKRANSLGATGSTQYGDLVFASLSAERISDLAFGKGVRKVEQRPEPRVFSTSEGVDTTYANLVHDEGYTGAGVTVAVIDLQFNPDQSEITDQIVDTIGNSTNFKSGTGGLHGTACAEIVAEMLPDADLVLASANGTNFVSLMDDITAAHDPQVMSMSLGYKPTLRLDGQDSYSNRIIDYTQASGSNTTTGGLFAVSAGNEANGNHWGGPVQTNANGYVEFDGGGSTYLQVDTTASGQEIVVQSDVSWHQNNQGYTIELYDSGKSHLDTFTKTTTPAQAVSVPANATSYIRIKNDSLSGTNNLDVFVWGNYVTLSPSTSDRSIGIPGTSPDSETLTVAAVEHYYDQLEPFSSRGPTQDGRRGVDISAPDGTKSDSWGGDFYGTSAACPHAAGAAGLMESAFDLTNVEIRQALSDTARPINDSSVGAPPNRKIGHGYVDVKSAYDLYALSLTVTGDTASVGGTATISIDASGVDSVTISDLWTDWWISSSTKDGATLSDDIENQGSVTFSWNSTQSSTTPSLTLSLPSRYVGGTYGIDGTASGPEGTLSASGTVQIQ